MSESMHADLLRSLGFKMRAKPSKDWNPGPPLKPVGEVVATSFPILREHPKASVPLPAVPWFVLMNGDTIVMDETRQAWELEGQELNLEDRGFNKLNY